MPDFLEPIEPNYDESKVPAYLLPDLLRSENGAAIPDAAAWQRERRPEILELFRRHVYGPAPEILPFEVEEFEREAPAFAGLAWRDQIRLRFRPGRDAPAVPAAPPDNDAPFLDLLIYRPARTDAAPLPVFLSLNFVGNHGTTRDPAVRFSASRTRNGDNFSKGERDESTRGAQASRWPYERLLARGYAVATFHYGDAAPDHPDQWREGAARLLMPGGSGAPASGEPGAIALWAWGLSRALDYLLTRSEFDRERVIVAGHSRQGKAALWSAAQDERFALAVSNDSGCGGAALSRRCVGETVAAINTSFPHWFCRDFHCFNRREETLPVDQHQLIALLAPRPVYVASATLDLWADPLGEFLAAKAAAPAYALFGQAGIASELQPPPDSPVGDRIGYHLRTGKHDITEWDWMRYADFADRHLPSRKPLRNEEVENGG